MSIISDEWPLGWSNCKPKFHFDIVDHFTKKASEVEQKVNTIKADSKQNDLIRIFDIEDAVIISETHIKAPATTWK